MLMEEQTIDNPQKEKIIMSQGKRKKETPSVGIHVEGGVHAGRDIIQGNQYNLAPHDFQLANVTSPAEFAEKLVEILNAVTVLKQQPELSSAQIRNIEIAEEQITEASEKAKGTNIDGAEVKDLLTKAKETFDLLSGSIAAAAGLGVVLGNMAKLAIQVFEG